MAVSSRGRLELSKQWKGRDTSLERRKVWTELKPKSIERKVPVVYYLSRNGHLDHPHFMEVSLSSTEGLYLRDVIKRLNFLRGKGMANMYSWSFKRSYKNGFVWHDLSEDDFIYPAHGNEYVLKGSELLNLSSSSRSQDTTSSCSSSEKNHQIPNSVQDDSDLSRFRKKTPWNSLDLNEYKVYKSDLTAEACIKAADASTQTDDKRQRRRSIVRDEERAEIPSPEKENQNPNPSTVIERDEIEISPPPSSSSPETLESLIIADRRLIAVGSDDLNRTVSNYSRGRFSASAVLMHLITCGSISVKDHGFSPGVNYRGRLPRVGPETKEMEGLTENPCFTAVRLENKEYFSGSLIETRKEESDGVAEFSGLKRSNSYNADKSSKSELAEKEIEGVQAKCIPRKLKTTARKDGNGSIWRSAHGSKRINDEPPLK